MKPAFVDDRATLAACGALAFALANMSHEALGHGLATLAIGGKAVLLTTCYFDSSGPYSKFIPAAGGLMNVAVGLISLAVLRWFQRLGALWRYFLVLVAAFNLFFAFGYPAYSGIALFGDWAAVISGLTPAWFWRVLLVVISVAGYYGSMLLLTTAIAPFARVAGEAKGGPLAAARFRRVTLTPYLAAILLACLAGAFNPKGWLTMLTAGFPAAAAAFGLTQLDNLIYAGKSGAGEEVVEPIQRIPALIAGAAVVSVLFIAVLGPGIRFSH